MSNLFTRYLARRQAAVAERDVDETAALEAKLNAKAKQQAGFFPMPSREFVTERVNAALEGVRNDLRLQTLRLPRLYRLCGHDEVGMGVAFALLRDLETGIEDTAFRRLLGEVIISAILDDPVARTESVRMWRSLCRHYGPGGCHVDEEPITLFEVREVIPISFDDLP